ncbi:hypothetical protein FB45DRAFT_1053330 [Roridomyces roridus]|uniref:F-box domain-containing protein n=1 Tax=Roridomyces roridus TaxID=1738132 RepID=A0AAD7CE51_9AGAR|nr:hypothetical protein FB45DRAFT_1053330 [Roridomyces roridus]
MDTISSTLMLAGHFASPGYEQATKDLIRAAEANIARIESQIRDLELLRDRERGFVAALKQIAAPIRKVPAEVLLRVFRTVFDMQWELQTSLHTLWADPDCPRDRLKRVVTVSHVCAHWRRLTPLTRISKPQKLSSSVVLDGESPEGSHLPEIVYNSAPRWSSLDFRDASLSGLSNLPVDTFKELLTVTLRSSKTPMPFFEPIRAFLRAHRLHTVHLEVASPDRYHMPWSQLAHLTTHDVDGNPQTFVNLLIQCTNLVEACFGEMVPWDQPPPNSSSSTPVQLPRLKSLLLHFKSDGLVTPFFARLALPALEGLYIEAADFTPFLRRSPISGKLNITNILLTPENVVALLTHSTSLVDIHLEFCCDGTECLDAALECLVYSDANAVHIAPRLGRIAIIVENPPGDEEILERAIVSRWWTDPELAAMPIPPLVARWESFYIWSNREEEYNEDFSSKITQLKQEGLQITI